MEFIAASLGVRCDHCHVVGPQGGFDKDEKKPKETARQMMQMVNDINTRAFEGRQRVGCATCHHGRTPPERTPPLATEMTPAEAARAAQQRAARGGGPGGPPPGAAPGQPGMAPGQPGGRGRGAAPAEPADEPHPTETIDQVVDKYVQALGGQSALTQAKTRVMKGTATTRDLQTVPVTVQEKASGEYRIDLETTPRPTDSCDRRQGHLGADGSQYARCGRPAGTAGDAARRLRRPADHETALQEPHRLALQQQSRTGTPFW